jgi:hypothetical protein
VVCLKLSPIGSSALASDRTPQRAAESTAGTIPISSVSSTTPSRYPIAIDPPPQPSLAKNRAASVPLLAPAASVPFSSSYHSCACSAPSCSNTGPSSGGWRPATEARWLLDGQATLKPSTLVTARVGLVSVPYHFAQVSLILRRARLRFANYIRRLRRRSAVF